jgi:hypothetical protein
MKKVIIPVLIIFLGVVGFSVLKGQPKKKKFYLLK